MTRLATQAGADGQNEGVGVPIVDQLRAREAQHREHIANSQVVIDLLAPQMAAFEKRDGSHNTYAVRMSVDHQSSVRTTTKEADELSEAADLIIELVEALEGLVEGLPDECEYELVQNGFTPNEARKLTVARAALTKAKARQS